MSDLKNLMISVSGVRGIVGEGLTPEVVLQFAQAYGSQFGPGKIVVGRDSRVSGEMVKNAVWSGLMAVGCDVIDIGIAPTPTTQMAAERPDVCGGIIITASHNPIEWNALKLLAPDGLFLDAEQGAAILNRVKSKEFSFCRWDKIGKIHRYENAIQDHIDTILKLDIIDVDAIRKRRFKVVADCCNGAGGTILPQLLEAFGCEAVFLNLAPNGLFPRSPEPIPANLSELCQAVKDHRADFGLAVDPDVDRLALVSEKGEPLGEEYTLTLVSKLVLEKTPGNVVINASTTRAIEDIAEQSGSKVYRTKVGEIHVAKKARKVNAVISGEGNGGVIYPKLHFGRDAPVGIALTLQHLIEYDGSISELHASLPQYQMVKDKKSLPFGLNAQKIVDQLAQQDHTAEIDLTDGLLFLLEKSWVHVRASNTEPIIRVMAEAPTLNEAKELVEKYKIKLGEIITF